MSIMKEAQLIFNDKTYSIRFLDGNHVADEFVKRLPVTSTANNIGGEIYFRVPCVKLEYDGTEKDEFTIGDVVYWKHPGGEEKYAIAILYGNTQYSNWKTPKTSSACVKIGEITENNIDMKEILTGETVEIQEKT